MKKSVPIFMILCLLILETGCTNNSSADWAYSFVVWNEDMYKVSDESVEEVGEKIGELAIYSDQEGSYTGNFSNKFEKGTSYYSIPGISTEEAIAVQDEDKFRKVIREGKYGGK